MGFYSKQFTYDGLSSEMFNLQIANIEGGGAQTFPGSGGVEIIESYIFRKPKPYFYGIHYVGKTSFPVAFFSPDEINEIDLSYIQDWLFGQLNYKQLAIIQNDMDEVYFNCIFTDPQIVRVGNIIYGIQGTCVCDSQFAWTYPKTLTYNYTTPPSGSSIVFYNNSHYKGYLYPQMTFTMNNTGGSVVIINSSDNNREFSFSDLSANEIITINNDLGIVQSSLNIPRLSNFNKNFFRFIQGTNNITITGNLSQLTLIYQFARRLGG